MSGDKPLANALDGAAALTVVGIWLQWVPVVAGVVTIIYTIWRLISSLDYRRQRKQFPFAPFGSQGIDAKHPHKDGEQQ